ncbi:hypothetical protein SAMN05660443_2056 [Marinospirillum celere]|uniref:GNAT family N-acetyltransferase n=1 Tax=Marinospirillum celere TaxID=1122252 RepID=A0A1I1HVI2_9GAMM|nr:GNAT family N-acetyltransferase [Marinospirillum celere]SFC28159.1 hypothetical protein SAMN05660443_2056 [Marinospirillum celere]
MICRWHASICELPTTSWQQLDSSGGYPFLRREFLETLETSGCVSRATGWEPWHASVWEGDQLLAVMPSYRKYHSRGEYVFDFQWAEAYRHFPDPMTGLRGRDYYPKLLTAVPFTPASGPRLLMAKGVEVQAVLKCLLEAIQQQLTAIGEPGASLSSWHLLFPDQQQLASLQATWPETLLERHGCQFHWFNRGYEDFDAFLAAMTSKRRKEIRRERRKVEAQELTLERFSGAAITQQMLRQFFGFYQMTYHLRGQHPYLTEEFFVELLKGMSDSLMLVLAEYQGQKVAGALFFEDATTLYGRYWGALVDADCLHFEACYYQGIEYAIERGLQRFDPGTQGEHKIPRGFEPVMTHSLHALPDPGFAAAVKEFLGRERLAVADYAEQARQLLPFRKS